MWKTPINFITIHYAYIISFGILALVILCPYGNLSAIDAYFFGVSASTESGLNPVDVKDLETYQQIFVYITPIVTNLGFINIIVVVVRLRWFRQRFKGLVTRDSTNMTWDHDRKLGITSSAQATRDLEWGVTNGSNEHSTIPSTEMSVPLHERSKDAAGPGHITFATDTRCNDDEKRAFHIPGPQERENGQPISSLLCDEDADTIRSAPEAAGPSTSICRRRSDTRSLSKATSIEQAVSSIFVLGNTTDRLCQDKPKSLKQIELSSLIPEELGGIEYRALRMLLKITTGYFIGLHTFGVLCLLPWIHLADAKYRDYLAELGEDKTWWAFYSAQTMVNNLGLTLTPDSMIRFRDATWPMLVMSFLAFAGNTFYPCFLRLLIWTTYKLSRATSSTKEPLRFLLDHPRRCYTLLFPGTATWILAAILVVLNLLDTLLIIVLDLDNPEVNVLPVGPRILAALYQAASSRHTGTSTFNLANVNPAVQFSLLVMMYISIYPIAISIRMSTSYEEQTIGIYGTEEDTDDKQGGKNYLLHHMRNQLSFDLWYIFLGVFCVCCAESKRIMSREDYAFSVFSIFFEVVSAYGNVGLSLGHPSNSTSLSGHFTVFAKLVICAMMIRGRHRGLPLSIDRAITLPGDYCEAEVADEDYKRVEKQA